MSSDMSSQKRSQTGPAADSGNLVDIRDPDHPKAIWIVRPDGKDGQFALNQAGLVSIFDREDLAGMPVALYSLAGTFRKGKSFLLTFFLRYFNSGQKADWLQQQGPYLNPGFHWRGGAKGDTEGVHIWSEPFIVPAGNQQIALFLMDSQGSSDPKKKSVESTKAFALSALLSSVLIFNVSTNVTADDHHNLQLFTNYGKFARQHKKKSGSSQPHSLQNLTYLIRDWFDPDEYPYGMQGGKHYLDDVIFSGANADEIKSVEKDIRNEFQDVSCFLLPNPGPIVAERASSNHNKLLLSDIKPQFLQYVDELIGMLFKPGHIVPKDFNGKLATGPDVINMTLAYYKIFQSGIMPEIDTIYDATTKVALQQTVDHCEKIYLATMEQEQHAQGFLEPEILLQFINGVKQRVFGQFDQEADFGSKKLQKKYMKKLVEKLAQHDMLFHQKNTVFFEEKKTEYRQVMETVVEMYKTKMTQEMKAQNFEDHKISSHESCKREALADFDSFAPPGPAEMKQKYKDKADKSIDLEFQQLLMQDQQVKERMKSELRHAMDMIVTDCKAQINEKMVRQMFNDDEHQLNVTVHESCKQDALARFDRAAPNCSDEMKLKYMDKARKSIDLEFQQLLIDYQRYGDNLKRDLSQASILAKESYKSKMAMTLGDAYYDDDYFNQTHDEALQTAMSIFHAGSAGKGLPIRDKHERELSSDLCRERENFVRTNEINKKSADMEITIHMKSAREKYNQRMTKLVGSGYVSGERLNEAHVESEQEVKQFFRSLQNEKGDHIVSLCMSQLDDVLGNLKKQHKASNELRKEGALNAIGKAKIMAVQRCNEIMNKSASDGDLTREELLTKHNSAKREAIEIFQRESPKDPQEGYRAALRDLYSDLENSFTTKVEQIYEKKEADANKIEEIREKAAERYTNAMEKFIGSQYLSGNEIDNKHISAKSEATMFFKRRSPRQPADIYAEAFDQLEDDVEKYRDIMARRNAENMDRLKDACDLILERHKDAYLEEMAQFCRDKYVEPSALDAKHRVVKQELLMKSGDDAATADFFKRDHARLLDVKLDALLEQPVKPNNESKQGFWRHVGEWCSDAASSVKDSVKNAASTVEDFFKTLF